MGQSNSLDHQGIPVSEIKDEVLKHAAVLTKIAVLSYDNFLQMVNELNRISVSLPDKSGKKLIFLVKKRTDASIFWKSTVRIACVRVITSSGKIETYRLMNLKEFLQVYKMVNYHASAAPPSNEPITEDGGAAGCSLDETSVKVLDVEDSRQCSVHKEFFDTSIILDGISVVKDMATDLDECCICMERKPETTLPCAHSYCMKCIDEWNVSHNTCPLCREKLESTDESWVIFDAPDSKEVQQELEQTLLYISEEKSRDA